MADNKYSRRQFLKTVGLAAGGIAAAPILQACAPAATVAPVATATSAPPVKIGVLLPYSDIYAGLGESITAAMEMYLDSVGGTAGGRKIQLIKEDEGATVDPAVAKAKKLVEQDEVAFVTGVVSSGVLAALRDYFHNNKKLLLCSNGGANALSRAVKTPYIWRTSFTNWQPNWPVGTWAAKNVGTKAFISVPDYGAGNDTIASFSNSFKAAGGTIIATQKTPFPNMGDPAPFITEIQKAGPDFLYCFYSGGASVTFLKAWGQFGLAGKIPLLGSGFMVEEDVMPSLGDTANGVRSGLHWAYGLDNAENTKFKDDYKKKTGKDANVFAVQGYDTARLIVETLNTLKGDVSNVDKIIETMSGVTFKGPRGVFALDKNSQAPKQHIYLRQVKKGTDGNYHNAVLEDLGEIVDPGDNSKG